MRGHTFRTPSEAVRRACGSRARCGLRTCCIVTASRIGVPGVMPRRDNAAPVRHSTVTAGSARNARSDMPERYGGYCPFRVYPQLVAAGFGAPGRRRIGAMKTPRATTTLSDLHRA